ARANASWTISSAASMSRTIRSTEATTRPYSSRNVSATRAGTPPSAVCPRGIDPTGRWYSKLHLPDRSYVDEAVGAERDLLRPLEGFLLAGALDQVEAAQHFLRLGEGAIGDLALSSLRADAAGVGVRPQALAHDHLAGRAQLFGEAHVALRHGGLGLLVGTDEQHVAHTPSSDGRYERCLWRPLILYDDDGLRKSTRGPSAGTP